MMAYDVAVVCCLLASAGPPDDQPRVGPAGPKSKPAAKRPTGSPGARKPPAVEIIAHRGASEDAPENTVLAMQLAWQQRADGSEFDVFLTKDKKIVVIHDKDTKRTGSGAKNLLVKDSTFAELRKLDFGKWKSPRFAGVAIPTLDEMLAAVLPDKFAFIEVKCGPEIVPELKKTLVKCKLQPQQTPVIAFNAKVIADLKRVHPKVPAYLLFDFKKKEGKERTAEFMIAKAKEVNADGLDLSALPDIDAAFVKKVKAAGLKLYVWTVDDPKLAKRLVAAGVDGITTNRPGFLREQLFPKKG